MAHFFKPKKKPSSAAPVTLQSLSIDRLSDDGRGIGVLSAEQTTVARDLGKTVFVDGALPGEVVNAQLTRTASRYLEARAIEVISKSDERVVPLCAHYEQCGGCHLQHLSVERQRAAKLDTVLGQLKKTGNIVPQSILDPVFAETYHYRRRVRLSVGGKKSRTLGFRQKNSHQIISVQDCPVATTRIVSLMTPVRDWLTSYMPDIDSVEMIDTDSGLGVVLIYRKHIEKSVQQALEHVLFSLNARCWFKKMNTSDKMDCAITDESVTQDSELLSYQLEIPVGGDKCSLRLYFQPQDFIQGHISVNQLMVNQALSLLAPQPHEQILDLFCGVGNFTLPLSRLARQVVGVEGINDMVMMARQNAAINTCDNVVFAQANLFDNTQWQSAEWASNSYDGIVLDPPRAGANNICENISKLNPKRIVYVSCDSAAFARDARLLADKGFTLAKLGLVDMFPQTYHSEVMALFVSSTWKM